MAPGDTRRGTALDGHLLLDEDSSYEAVVHALPLPAIATDLHGVVLIWNQAAERVFGWPADEIVGRPLPTLPQAAQCEFDRAMARILGGETIAGLETCRQKRDGTRIDLRVSASPLRDRDGAIIGALATFEDITREKKAREAAAESETRLRAIFNQTFQFIGLLSLDGTLLEANQAALGWSGSDRSQVVGRPFWDTPWWNFSSQAQEQLQRAVESAAHGSFVRYEIDAPHPQTGRVSTFDFSITPVKDDEGNVVLLIPEGRDITERKRFEEELARANEQILRWNAELEHKVAERTREIERYSQEMTARVLQAQEDERKRIARELHDDTAQSLSSLLISLDLLERNVRGNADTMSAGIKRAQGIAKRILDSTRALAHGLRPTILDDFGLDAALEWIAVDHTRTYGVPVTVSSEEIPAGRLDAETELALFRIAQEALTNSGKHAGATSAHIALSTADGRVVLVVEDNGSGFDLERLAAPTREGGLGLHGIRERVELLGAALDVHSAPGEGTRLTISVPWARTDVGAGRDPSRSVEEGVMV